MPSDKRIESNDAVAVPVERRRNLRYPFSATVEAVENKSGTKVIGRTSDLGLGGCYVDTLSPFPVGTEAKIKILRDNESFDAQAKVVYSLMGMGMGLAFVSALPKQVRVFQRWLQEISGQPPLAEETHPPSASDASPAQQTQTLKNVVLSDLIMTLMQKKVLTEEEGKDLLRKLFK
jgi:PilZ domain